MRKLTHEHGLLGRLWCVIVPCHEELKRMVAREVAWALELGADGLRDAAADSSQRRGLGGPEAERYGQRRDYARENLRAAQLHADGQRRMNEHTRRTRARFGEPLLRPETVAYPVGDATMPDVGPGVPLSGCSEWAADDELQPPPRLRPVWGI